MERQYASLKKQGVRKMGSKLPMERADSKFEARNPKFETNPNFQDSNAFLGLLFLNI